MKHLRSTLPITILLTIGVLAHGEDPARVPLDHYQQTIGDLHAPRDAAWLPDGRLAILEADTGTIRIIEPDGSSTKIETPCTFCGGLAVDSAGNIVVADTGRHRLMRFQPDGSWTSIGTRGAGPDQFRSPADVTIHDDHFIVADTGNDRIVILDGDGTGVRIIGDRGSEPGQFQRPLSVSVNDSGHIVIADTDNHRIQIVSMEGEPITQWGSWGSFPGLFQEPSSVECSGNQVLVADRLNHRVQVFSQDGTLLHVWGMHALRPREGEGRIHYPDALTVSPDEQRLAIVESFEDRVQLFGPHDPEWVDDRPTQPARRGIQSHFGPVVTLDDRILVVWEPEARTAIVFDHHRRTPIRLTSIFSTGEQNRGPGGFGHLADLHWDHTANRLHLFDSGTGQVHVYSLDLPDPNRPRFDPNMARLQTSHTLDPSIPTHRIVDAARGTDGRWYLLDETDATILVLDDMMQPLHKWGDGELIRPTSIVPDQSTSDFLVLDRGQQAVIRINSDGHTTDRITSDSIPGGLMNPTGLAVATNGELFLTDAGHHVVHRLAPDGTHLGSWGQRGSDHEEFWKPAGIVVDDQNRVIVLDHGNHRCQVFEPDGTWLMTFGAGRSYTPQNRPPASPDSD